MDFCFCCSLDLNIFNCPLNGRYKTSDGMEMCKKCFATLQERSAPIASDLLGVPSATVLKIIWGSFNKPFVNLEGMDENTTPQVTEEQPVKPVPNITINQASKPPIHNGQTTQNEETITNADGSVTRRIIKITTNSQNTGNIDMDGLFNSVFFNKKSLLGGAVNDLINLARDKKSDTTEEDTDNDANDTLEGLEKLVKMKEKGMLTDDEFAVMKKKLIEGD